MGVPSTAVMLKKASSRPSRRYRSGPTTPGGPGSAGQQQRVALAQRHVKVLGQAQDHRAGGPGPAGLHEAQVARRDVRLDGQVELAQPAPLAPLAEQVTHGPAELV